MNQVQFLERLKPSVIYFFMPPRTKTIIEYALVFLSTLQQCKNTIIILVLPSLRNLLFEFELEYNMKNLAHPKLFVINVEFEKKIMEMNLNFFLPDLPWSIHLWLVLTILHNSILDIHKDLIILNLDQEIGGLLIPVTKPTTFWTGTGIGLMLGKSLGSFSSLLGLPLSVIWVLAKTKCSGGPLSTIAFFFTAFRRMDKK